MELIFSNEVFVALLAIAFVAGFVDSVAGGGGLIMMPMLLTIGLQPHMALGTNKLASTLGTTISAGVYIKKRFFNPRLWLLTIVSTFIGALIGTFTAWIMSSDALKKIIPVFIILVAVYVLLPCRKQTHRPVTKPGKRSDIALGSLLGFYDGFIGPGTGSFWVSMSMLIYKIDIMQASAIARSMNFVSNIVSCLTFMALSSVNYSMGLSLGLALMLGSYIGVHSALKYGITYVKYFFVTIAALLALRLIWSEWF